MSSGGKYFVTLWGGLGDFVKMYYSHVQWRKLEAFKKQYPNTYIKAIVYSLNPNAKGLIEYHPCIDEVFQPKEKLLEVRAKGLGSYANGYAWLQNRKEITKKLPKSKPRIYLSEEDKQLFRKVRKKTKNKYIVIHPFSAMAPNLLTSRTTMSTEHYIPIIEGLEKKGYKIVLLGASRKNLTEEMEYSSRSCINLINKTSVRTALKLVAKSQGFIGTNSCFMCEAMLEKKPCFIITSYFWKNKAYKNGFIAQGLKNTRSTFTFLPQNRANANYKEIQTGAINWFN